MPAGINVDRYIVEDRNKGREEQRDSCCSIEQMHLNKYESKLLYFLLIVNQAKIIVYSGIFDNMIVDHVTSANP